MPFVFLAFSVQGYKKNQKNRWHYGAEENPKTLIKEGTDLL